MSSSPVERACIWSAFRVLATALALSAMACTPADVPGDLPAPGTEADRASETAQISDACRQLDAMLAGVRYSDARLSLQAAGYRLQAATDTVLQQVAGDAVACGQQACTADYVADGEERLRLTVAMDEDRPDDEWLVGGWDTASCRSMP